MMAQIQAWFVEYGVFLSIPIVSALVGYATNWLAVKMMMYPVDFIGIGPLGWQGVVPGSAKKMSRVLVEQSIGKVISQQEIVERVDFSHLAAMMNHRVEHLTRKLVDQLMRDTELWGRYSVSKFVWSAAPGRLHEAVYSRIQKGMPELVESITQDFRRDFESIGDINESIIRRLEDKKQLLINIFLNAAGKEFKFLALSGLYFGFPLGVPVMFIWNYYPEWWVLPLFGLLVGYLTNELAIYMVQKPLQPKKILGIEFQGLFVKRQKEISRYLGEVFAKELLNAEKLSKDLLQDSASVDKIQQMVYQSVSDAYAHFPGIVKPFLAASIGPDEIEKGKTIVTDIIMTELRDPDPRYYRHIDEKLDIANTLALRLGTMPPDEFFGLLHPVIAEDQWKLIAVGAVLGFGAGCLQWVLLG